MFVIKQILIKNSLFFLQAAILIDGKLDDFIYEEKKRESFLGNIYKGKVENILPGIEAAFVNVGLDKNAYLYKDGLLSDKFLKEKDINKRDVTSISNVLKKGEEILVQINREAMGEKNISVTTDISLPGKLITLIPKSIDVKVSAKIKDKSEKNRLLEIGRSIMKDGNGLIFRTYSENKEKEEIEKEYEMLSSIYKQIEKEYNYSYAPKLLYRSNPIIDKLFKDYVDSSVDEIYTDDREIKVRLEELINSYNSSDELGRIKIIPTEDELFENFNIDKQINRLFERKIELENGGSIFIDVTEAMTVIDVNSGSYIGDFDFEKTALSMNLSALEEIARQIKLRNLSGIILIDFIDLKSQDYIDTLIYAAKTTFRKDKSKVEVVDMTKLNIMEITRKKNKENFYNMMSEDCEHCNGSGRVSSRIKIVLKIENIIMRIKKNTSCEAVKLIAGSIVYNKIVSGCMDEINDISKRYGIKINFEESTMILTDEVTIGRISKA